MPIVNTSDLPTGNLRGADHGASVSLIFDHSEPGKGPRLHRHPYDEVWVVKEGSVSFRLGDTSHSVGPGDIVIAPADVPHGFVNDGTERLDLVCIHASPTFNTEWLE